jgi:RNA polymerase sigma-70 factor (ECF subfamily)
MATAAITATNPALGAFWPGRAGSDVLAAGGRWKPTSRGLDQEYTLVQRCLSGDATGWEEMVRLHTRRVYALCYRFTGSNAEAQDLTQDIFLRVFRTLGSYRSTEGSLVTWLTRLSRNLLIDHYRRSKQDRVTEPIEDQLARLEQKEYPGEASVRPDRVLAGREASEVLQAALGKLSPELRETVILRDLQELEYREIAAVLKIPEGTVKSRLNRGRAELARLLRRQRAAL